MIRDRTVDESGRQEKIKTSQRVTQDAFAQARCHVSVSVLSLKVIKTKTHQWVGKIGFFLSSPSTGEVGKTVFQQSTILIGTQVVFVWGTRWGNLKDFCVFFFLSLSQSQCPF